MTTCTWPGCDRPLYARGLCRFGYARIHRGWIDHDTSNSPRVIRDAICTWLGCDQPHFGRGLCVKGYTRVHTNGWIDHDTPPVRPGVPDTCTWPGCEKPYKSLGLCKMGYTRVSRGWLDHDTPQPRRDPRPCTWPGCTEPIVANGLCRTGYNRVHTQGWIDHDTPSNTPTCHTPSRTVYIAHHRDMGAVKVGVGWPARQQQHARRGWDIIGTWEYDTPGAARNAERRVLDLWDGWTGYLTAEQMPQAGHTETVDARVYDAAAVRFALAG